MHDQETRNRENHWHGFKDIEIRFMRDETVGGWVLPRGELYQTEEDADLAHPISQRDGKIERRK